MVREHLSDGDCGGVGDLREGGLDEAPRRVAGKNPPGSLLLCDQSRLGSRFHLALTSPSNRTRLFARRTFVGHISYGF